MRLLGRRGAKQGALYDAGGVHQLAHAGQLGGFEHGLTKRFLRGEY